MKILIFTIFNFSRCYLRVYFLFGGDVLGRFLRGIKSVDKMISSELGWGILVVLLGLGFIAFR